MIHIVCDSTCDLPKELAAERGITILPLHVFLGDEEYLDGVNIEPKDLYAWSDANKSTPKTSAIGIEDTMNTFRELLGETDEIIAFPISETMSTSGNVMRLAAEELEASERVSVVDSMSLSSGIGLLALEALDKVKEGFSRGEIVSYLEEIRPRVRASFVINELTYLHRGGRCSAVAALAGSILKLHPEINVIDGKMVPGKKYRGSFDKAVADYVKDRTEAFTQAKPDRIFITDSGNCDDYVAAILKRLREMNRFAEIIPNKAGGVISSHCGPDTLGVLFIAGE